MRRFHISDLPMLVCGAVILWDILALVSGMTPTTRAKVILDRLQGQTVVITGTIAKDPKVDESKIGLTLGELELKTGAGSSSGEGSGSNGGSGSGATSVPLEGKIYVQLSSRGQNLAREDRVTLEGELADGFGTFLASLYRPEVRAIEKSGNPYLELRAEIKTKISENLPASSQSLGFGYLLGDKSELDAELEETMRVVGLTHLIVASGTHLGILTGLARKLFGKVSRLFGLAAALLFTLVFIGITGATPSMTRAGLVSLISLLCWYFGRDLKPTRLLLYVATITILINPEYPLDLAWLLSFASFTAILLIAPLLERFFFGKQRKPPKLASLILSAVAASLLVAPILFYFYGQISLISIAANLLVAPTLALTMLTTAAAAILPPAGLVAHALIQYHIAVVGLLAEQEYFLVQIEAENPLVFLIYLPIIILLIIIHRRC